ncbi:KDEL-tailed cysteine endopeptidase CEP1 [Hordeum vulgare]|nr:KDEL-tailed cysteine endopeptidase CEP1 [Hordeum vulgare]
MSYSPELSRIIEIEKLTIETDGATNAAEGEGWVDKLFDLDDTVDTIVAGLKRSEGGHLRRHGRHIDSEQRGEEIGPHGRWRVHVEEDRDPDTVPYFDEKDLVSDETLWALYERWCRFHEMARDHDEMARRFGRFKLKARHVYEFNKSGRSYTKGLTRFSDLEPGEFFAPRRCPRTPRIGSRFFTNDRGEVTAICTDGRLEKYEGPVWKIRNGKQP